ncbi:MAG: PQQ-like beta-propeller repeat protein [Candidatus Coatesbacteria bacterium]|nr:PQQ-like beta-propeller repeat protein [Candidatus Coatesbacteria bacterium]
MKLGRLGISATAVFVLVIVMAAIPLLTNADPVWSKFGANGSQNRRSSEVSARTGDGLWTFETGNFNFCSPAINENEEVCLGSRNGLFFALSPIGDLNWIFDAIARVDSSPAIDTAGNIYFGANNGLVYCINAPSAGGTQGTLRWSFDAGDTVFSSPTLDESEESVIFGTEDGVLMSIFSDNFAATQGTLEWSHLLGDRIFASPAYRYYDLAPTSDPAGDVAMVYIGAEIGLSDGLMYGVEVPIDPAASTLATIQWVYPGVGDDAVGRIQSSVAVSDDGNFIYFGSKDGNLYCLTSSGYLQWTYGTNGMIDSSPGILSTGEIVVGSRDGAVYCVDEEGTLQWSFETGDTIESSPAIDANDNILIGSRDYFLYSISPTGAQNWRYMSDYHIWSSPVIGKQFYDPSGIQQAVTTATIYFTGADMKVHAICEDRAAPYLLSRTPDDGETGVSKRLANIVFEVVDAQTDVDREEIFMLFREHQVHPSFERIEGEGYRGWKCTFYCGDETFQYDEEVTINVQAYDTAWEPNLMEETYSFTIESSSKRSLAAPTQLKPRGLASPQATEVR